MKTVAIFLLLIFAIVKIQAQNYQISFTGTGASNTVDSVKVENISQCTDTILNGSNILSLTTTTPTNNSDNKPEDALNIYPNPMTTHCFFDFEATANGKTDIELYDVTGKLIIHLQETFAKGHYTYNLSGISSGIYMLKITSANYSYASKIVSQREKSGTPEIIPAPDNQNTPKVKSLSGNKSLIAMSFNAGDTLKLTGKSNIYKMVVMLTPTQSQTVTFNFVACTDADSNHYAVVQIGTQVWMGENLKTTKYRDGSAIPNVSDSATWGNTTQGAYCDFQNLPAEGSYYGHLYNFYAVVNSHNICPSGWHVPSNSEWNILEKLLDNTDDTVTLGGRGTIIGRILKEDCNTRWQYQDSTCGTNAVGFTGLCANYRVSSGAWSLAPNNNHDTGFWTSTSYTSSNAWYRSLRWCFGDIYALFPMKKSGNSVRCIKD